MNVRSVSAAILSLLVIACGGAGGTVGSAAPTGLAWRVPDPATVRYTISDTARVDIDAGGQSLQARAGAAGVVTTAFRGSGDGVEVTYTFDEYSGRLSQPMAGAVTVDAGDIEGPIVFTLDRRGAATLVAAPEVSTSASALVIPLQIAHTFFPRLPGSSVGVGQSWTDTIRYAGPLNGGETTSTTVLTHTVRGDSVVAGRTVLVVDVAGTTDQVSDVSMSGQSVHQDVAGDVEGWFLWDPAAGLLVESLTGTDVRGTMEVAVAPFPLQVRIRGESRAKLTGR